MYMVDRICLCLWHWLVGKSWIQLKLSKCDGERLERGQRVFELKHQESGKGQYINVSLLMSEKVVVKSG